MRITSITSKASILVLRTSGGHISVRPSPYMEGETQIIKLLWRHLVDVYGARAELKKHFGPMEIKEIKNGYALYTRVYRKYPRHLVRAKSYGRSVIKTIKRDQGRDKFLVGASVKLASNVPEHFIKEAHLNRGETYFISEKHSVKARGDLSKRKGYILENSNGFVFYSYDLIPTL